MNEEKDDGLVTCSRCNKRTPPVVYFQPMETRFHRYWLCPSCYDLTYEEAFGKRKKVNRNEQNH